MKIRNLDTFYWIATLGSFRAASEKLNLTQPAISARIQVLEQDLGAEVFIREMRNAELTQEGRRLFPFAEKLMRLDQEVLAAFSETAKVEQLVRLGSSETIISTWLPDFMSALRQSKRGISFDLTVDSTDNLRNALVAREIDLAFLMGPVAEVSITNKELCSFEMVFAAAANIANQKVKWSETDIANQPILTFANNTKPSRQVRELLTPFASSTLDMTTSTSIGALIRLAKSGLGICALPRAVIVSEIAAGELIELQTNLKLPHISFTASYVSSSPINGLTRQISEDVAAFLQSRLIKNIYHI